MMHVWTEKDKRLDSMEEELELLGSPETENQVTFIGRRPVDAGRAMETGQYDQQQSLDKLEAPHSCAVPTCLSRLLSVVSTAVQGHSLHFFAQPVLPTARPIFVHFFFTAAQEQQIVAPFGCEHEEGSGLLCRS